LRTDRDATPVTLPEHLRTSVFCRLEGGDTFANRDGDCTFGQVCYDNIEDTKTLTGQTVLRIPAGNGALCTWNPDQPRLFAGEEELRNQHGLEVMSTLAEYLARMAVTGSLKGQLIGVFPNSVSSAIFSVELSRPMVASIVSTAGVAPSIARCGVRGCLLGPETHQYHWIFDQTNHLIYHFGSRLCLDVKDNAASPGASVVLWTCNGTPTQKWDKARLPPYTLVNTASNLCVTVASLTGNPRFVDPTAARSLSLQPCDGRGSQKFSNDDGTIVGPR
jgi:hypothetical protein